MSLTEARKRLFDITDIVQRTSQHYTLTERGQARAVLMSADEFDAWVETLEIMNNPALMKAITASQHDFKTRNYVPLDEVLVKSHYVRGRSAQTRRKKSAKN